MIQPEPRFQFLELGPDQVGLVRVPGVAGRLGVIEEKCLGSHDPDEYFDGNCNFCGGEV